MFSDFYSKLGKKEKFMFFLAFMFVMAAIMDRLVLGPILEELKTIQKGIDTKLVTIRRNLRILSFKQGILDDYAKYENYLDSGKKTKEEIVSSLLREIETIAGEKSVTVSNIQPGDVTNNPVMEEYKTGLECLGRLQDILEFMQALEESDYLFQITKYTIAPKSKGSDIMKCSLSISRVFMTTEKA